MKSPRLLSGFVFPRRGDRVALGLIRLWHSPSQNWGSPQSAF
ncbi:Uncharacterised protein [Vibrio cholerae]|nr:Uncharacterised protein [Vibrio cholerae]